MKAAAVGLILIVVTVLTGCASAIVLGKVYDGFGSQTAKRFKSYATFNDSQTQQIDSLAASYHSWHRSTQLGRYAEFLRSIVENIESDNQLSVDQAGIWWQTVRGFSDDMRACNPFNVAADLLAGLSDKQVNQMAGRLRKELNQHEDEYHAETRSQRTERRVKEVSKWGKRVGAKFNKAQSDLLRETLTIQISLGAQRYELRRMWMEEFLLLLSQRVQVDFKDKITRHIDSGWRITEQAFPRQWQYNEQLWTGFLKDFINLQSSQQRQVFIDKAINTAQTLEKLSDKQVDQMPVCHSLR